jgi:hypothetical protein
VLMLSGGVFLVVVTVITVVVRGGGRLRRFLSAPARYVLSRRYND